MKTGKHLVLAGAGHAHMQTLSELAAFLQRGHRVTVIGPEDFHYYSGMGPGVLGGTYQDHQIRFDSRRTTEQAGGRFVRDRVEAIDAMNNRVLLGSGAWVAYDVLSLNLGSVVNNRLGFDGSCGLYPVKPIVNLAKARQTILQWRQDRTLEIVVVGGGGSAAEVAGNLVQLLGKNGNSSGRVTVLCRSGFLGQCSARVRKHAAGFLAGRGVNFLEGDPAVEVREGMVVTRSGTRLAADLVFAAQGIVANPVIRLSGLPVAEDGGLLVNENLQCSEHPNIFAGGDCACFYQQPLAKVGVYAVRQNPILCANLLRALEGKPLEPFVPGGGYLLIYNLGGGIGVLEKGWLFWHGRAAFWLKDWIDRRFVAAYA